MKTPYSIIIFLFFVLLSGCVPFASDEFNTKIWMSEERRIEAFKNDLDYQIGRGFYDGRGKSVICSIHKCNDISEYITEYIYDFVTNTSPPRNCVYALVVDASQLLKEDYQYGTGPRDYGLGKIIKWRYISNPDQCLTSIGFMGPW